MPGSVAAGRGANSSLLSSIKNALPYNPAAASGLLYRLRVSSLSGFKHGDPISSVTSEVGGLTLTQGSSGYQPIYISNGLNNKPAMRFDGVDDFLSGTVTSAALPLTFVFIMNLRSTVGDQQVLYSGGPELLINNTATAWQVYNNGVGVSGNAPVLGGQSLIATYPASGSSALYVNGAQAVSGTTGTSAMTTFTLGCRSQGNKHVRADFYEVLVYSGTLSALDRSRIDSYAQLAYGISVTDYRSSLGDAPALITGMSARYRADQITGIADGSAVTTWPDVSGNFYDASQATAASQPTWVASALNGQPIVRFNGTSQYMTSLAPASDPQQTLIAVMRYTSTSQPMAVRSSSVSGGLQFRINTTQKIGLVKQNVTNIAESTGIVPINTYTAAVAAYIANNGPFAFRVNGASAGNGNVSQFYVASTTVIGYNPSNTAEYLAGDIAELICYNRALTAVEFRLIESYIQDRYAIAVADYYIDDAVNQIGGVTARYRADKIVGIADGGTVPAWPDCSSNNNPALQATAANQPTFALNSMNGQPVVRFNGSSHVLATAATTWGPNYTVFVVHKVTTFAANAGPLGNDYSTTVGASSQRVFRLAYGSSTQLTGTTYYGNAATSEADSVTATTGLAAVASLTRSASGIETTFNGITDGVTSSANTPTSTPNGQLTLGALTPTANYFNGDIAEVIVFNRALSSAERSQVHTYVTNRYGIVTVDASITDTVSAIPGIQARFRADTIQNVANGGTVQCWGDSSGNGYNAIQAGSISLPLLTTNALNTQPVVTFDGTRALASAYPGPTGPFSIVAIMRNQAGSPGVAQTIVSGINGGLQIRMSNNQLQMLRQTVSAIATNSVTHTVGAYNASVSTYANTGTYTFTTNGTAGTSGTSATPLAVSGTTLIGMKGVTNTEFLVGDIAELIIFDRVLGSYEIAQIDTYANARYGISITDKITPIASETFTTADSASWPSQWTMSTGGSYANYSLENGQGVLLSTDTTSYAKGYLSGSPSFTNGGIYFTARFPNVIDYSFTELNVNLSTDGSGTQNDYNAYSFRIRIDKGYYNAMNIYKIVNGSLSINMTYTSSVVNGPLLNFRCERIDTLLRFKVWSAGSNEPGTWMATGVDGSGSPFGAGRVSITNRSVSTVGGPVFFDNISVYTIG